MLSTIDDSGIYHSAHLIQSYHAPGGHVGPRHGHDAPVLTRRWTRRSSTRCRWPPVDGTGYRRGDERRPSHHRQDRYHAPIAQSAFFIGAIPQYSLIVGIFTQSQYDQHATVPLRPRRTGAFGGTWPAAIWNTFAEDEFAQATRGAVPAAGVHRGQMEPGREHPEGEKEAAEEGRDARRARSRPPRAQPVPEPEADLYLRPAHHHAERDGEPDRHGDRYANIHGYGHWPARAWRRCRGGRGQGKRRPGGRGLGRRVLGAAGIATVGTRVQTPPQAPVWRGRLA